MAETPVALIIANLTHGYVGAVEFRPVWPRLRRRYADRFPEGKAVTCVVDHRMKHYLGEDGAGAEVLNIDPTLLRLAERDPRKVRAVWHDDQFEVWEVGLPVSEILTHKNSDLLWRWKTATRR